MPDESATSDQTEVQLLAALREKPGDEATRAVYADWLEQHGLEELARFVRGDEDGEMAAGEPADARWRAIVSCARIECTNAACPGTWDRMAPTERDRVRACGACGKYPVYCQTAGEARHVGRVGHPAAFDRPRRDELLKLRLEAQESWRYRTYNPPPPMRRFATPLREEPFAAACRLLEDARE